MSKGSPLLPWAAGFVMGALVGGVVVHFLHVAEGERRATSEAMEPDLAAATDLPDAGSVEPEDAAPLPAEDGGPVSAWAYREIRDDLRDTVRDVACTTSRDGFSLCVRTAYEDDPDIFVTLDRGTVGCGFNGCRVAARFDDAEVTTWRATRGETGQSVFIEDGGGFVRALLDAQRVIVEVDVYGRIPQQVAFDVAGLDWARPAPPARAPRGLPRCVDLLADGRTGPCR
jgi:hypothetical protein